MTVTLTSAVPVSAGPNDIVDVIIAPNVPGGGGLGIIDIFGLQAALDQKLDDTIGTIAPATVDVTITGAELNFLAGVTSLIQTQLDGKVDLTGDTMTGPLSFAGAVQFEADAGTVALPGIVSVGDPDTGFYWPLADTLGVSVGGLDAFHVLPSGLFETQVATYDTLVTAGGIGSIPNKKYVDDAISLAVGGPFLPLAGGVMAGDIDLNGVGRLRLDADGNSFLEAFVDDVVNLWVGGTVEFTFGASSLNVATKTIENVIDPTTLQQAATKNYVDTEIVALALNGVGPYLRLSGADTMVGNIDLGGNSLLLDADGNTFWESSANDLAQLWVGGSVVLSSDGTSIDINSLKLTSVATPTAAADGANKDYVDTEILSLSLNGTGPYVRLSGVDTMLGSLDMGTNQINSLVDPTLAQDGATKNYVDVQILALGLTSTGPFLRLTGADTMAGALDMGTQLINNVVDPVLAQSAATKNYTDITFMPIAGGVAATADLDMGTNKIINLGAPTAGGDATNKTYTDTTFLALVGGTMTGDIDIDSNFLLNIPTPTLAGHAANKNYVDTEILALGLGGATGPFLRLSGLDTMVGDLNMGATAQILSDDGALAVPGYAFLSDDTTGMFTDGTNLRFSLGAAAAMTVAPSGGANTVDVHGRTVTGAADPVVDSDLVTKGFLEAQQTTKLLGSVTGVDLKTLGSTAIYTLPAAKMHIVTHIIVRATSYSPGPGPVNPEISVGVSGTFDQFVANNTTVDLGGTAGASDQAAYFAPKDGSQTPNSGETVTIQVDLAAAGTFSPGGAFTVTVYILGIEL